MTFPFLYHWNKLHSLRICWKMKGVCCIQCPGMSSAMLYSPAAHRGRPLPMGWVYWPNCMYYIKWSWRYRRALTNILTNRLTNGFLGNIYRCVRYYDIALGTKHGWEGWVASDPRAWEVTPCPRAECIALQNWKNSGLDYCMVKRLVL